LLQRVGEDGQTIEGAFGVDRFREPADGGRLPGQIEGGGTDGVAEDAAENAWLCMTNRDPDHVFCAAAIFPFPFGKVVVRAAHRPHCPAPWVRSSYDPLCCRPAPPGCHP